MHIIHIFEADKGNADIHIIYNFEANKGSVDIHFIYIFEANKGSVDIHIIYIFEANNILCTSSYLNNRTLPPFSYFLGVKCGVHLCCNTCCDYIQLISVELPILGIYARNGQIYCNLIPRIPGSLQYKLNPKIIFCSFFIKLQLNKNN